MTVLRSGGAGWPDRAGANDWTGAAGGLVGGGTAPDPRAPSRLTHPVAVPSIWSLCAVHPLLFTVLLLGSGLGDVSPE